MIVAIMTTALSGTAAADEVVYYTLDGTQTGGTNGYATVSEITQNEITWMVTGNTDINPWRIGGKNLSGVDRPVYSTSTMSPNITKVVVTNGTATATVNSMTLVVSSNSDFSNPTSTVTGTWAASSTTTFERPSGADWSNKYFKLIYNVTAGGSNQYAQLVKAEFYYDNSGSSVKPNPTITVSSPVDALGDALSTLYVNENFYVTVTTTSDAAITYDSNEDELYVSSWNAGTGKMNIIPKKEGQFSITFSVAETDNFAEGEKTVTFTIVKRPTTCEIDVPDGFNNNIANGTTAGKLKGQLLGMTAVYNSQSDNPTIASLFTWTSSNEEVATIASDGTVTLVGAGTTTITCNFAGDDTYAASSATNVLTVINGVYVQPTTVEVNLNNSLFGTTYNGSVANLTDANALSGTIDNVTVTYGGTGNHYVNDSQIRFYPNNKLTFEAPDGYLIKSIVFTPAGTWAATISADTGTYTSSTKTWTGSATSVLFTGSGSSRCDMSKATITLASSSASQTYTLSWTAGEHTELFVFDAANETTPLTSVDEIAAGTTINVSIDVDEGYQLDALTVKDADDNDVTLSEITAGSYYSFTMPESDVTITSTAVESSVAPTNGATVTFDFSTNTFGFPQGSSNKTVDANDYTDGTYTINLEGSTGNGYYWHIDGYLIMGKEGATLTFPAFPFNVSKIKITGHSGASSNVEENFYVGENPVSTSAKDATKDHEFVIDENYQEAGNVYVLKVTNSYNTQIAKIEVFGYESVTVTDAGYATFASDNALDFTGSSIKAFYATESAAGTLSFTQVNKVPADTGVLLYADGGATVDVPVFTGAADEVTGNVFVRGEGVAVSYADENQNYILFNGADGIGFYRANNNTVATNRAYIHVTSNGVKSFVINLEDDATGISLMEDGRSQLEDGVIYNLAGQRINKMQKGINIVNGKKVLK